MDDSKNIKPLSAVLAKMQLPISSIAATLDKKHREIAEAAFAERSAMSEKEMRLIIAKVCTYSGLKPEEMPSDVMVNGIMEVYARKYSNLTTPKEVALAMDFNIMGEWETIEHYRTINPKWFCDVMNKYIEHRDEAVIRIRKKQQEEEIKALAAIPPPDPTNDMIREIIADYIYQFQNLSWHSGGSFSVMDKLELLGKMADCDVPDEIIRRLREKAISDIRKGLVGQIRDAVYNERLGLSVTLKNKRERLRLSQTSKEDEQEILAGLKKRLYWYILGTYPPQDGETEEDSYFVNGLKENII